LYGVGTSAVGSGNTLTLTVNLGFSPSFAGDRIIYMAARRNGDAFNSGWQAAGSLTVEYRQAVYTIQSTK